MKYIQYYRQKYINGKYEYDEIVGSDSCLRIDARWNITNSSQYGIYCPHSKQLKVRGIASHFTINYSPDERYSNGKPLTKYIPL